MSNSEQQIFLLSTNITSVFQMATKRSYVYLWTRWQINKKDKKKRKKNPTISMWLFVLERNSNKQEY